MSPQPRKTFLLAVTCLFIFSGCTNFAQPTPTPTATFTPTATITPTPPPSKTPTPTNTRLPPCDADQIIKKLKLSISYGESTVLYNKLQGTSYLLVWFVDPEINPTPTENEIALNADLAIRHALILSQELNASDTCVSRLFDMINAIVVDKNYNGWFSGQIKTADLPTTVQTDEKQLNEITQLYQIGYIRNKVTTKTGAIPSGNCTWVDTKLNIHRHFSPERENVAFYFVLDDMGVNVWAQWDSQPEFLQLNLPTSLLNIAMEMDCLFPKPDQIIFDVVDDTGETLVVGLWNWSDAKNQDIGQIQILYQK